MFGALRLYYVLTMNFADVTASQLPVVIMGTIEPGVAIMVSSSPLLKPVLDAAIRHVLALFGVTGSDRDTTVAVAGADATLQTIGGGYLKGKISRASRIGMRATSWKQVEVDDGENADHELTGWRAHKHEVAVTGRSDVKSGNGSESATCEETGYEDGILVTTRTLVTSRTRE